MASRSGGGGAWFIVGFLAGVGATLAAIIFATRPQPAHVAIPAAPSPMAAAPIVTYHPPSPQIQTPAPFQTGPAPAPAAPAATPAAPDQQVQEDAAAAGMTSRSRSGH